MRNDYDLDEILDLAKAGMTPSFIKGELLLGISVRQVQRLIKKHLGPRPTHASISRPNVLREAVAAYMRSQGLDSRYCSSCERCGVRECAIRALRPDLDSFVFVCAGRCAMPGDF